MGAATALSTDELIEFERVLAAADADASPFLEPRR